jgi:hypothetical protein
VKAQEEEEARRPHSALKMEFLWRCMRTMRGEREPAGCTVMQHTQRVRRVGCAVCSVGGGWWVGGDEAKWNTEPEIRRWH